MESDGASQRVGRGVLLQDAWYLPSKRGHGYQPLCISRSSSASPSALKDPLASNEAQETRLMTLNLPFAREYEA